MIEAGDLVIVIGSCCGENEKHIGRLGVVERITHYRAGVYCYWCGARIETPYTAELDWCEQAPVRYLRKIPPLAEAERRIESLPEQERKEVAEILRQQLKQHSFLRNS